MKSLLTVEQQMGVVSDYRTDLTPAAIRNKWGITSKNLCDLLNRHNISRRQFNPRRHLVNKSAFDVLTPEACYYLGFLITDGCLHSPRRGGSPLLTLSLHERDRDAVE